jgi:purine nucleoside permease
VAFREHPTGCASLLNAALSQSYVRAPKAIVISLFAPEADPWIKNLSLVQTITVPGLSPDFPDLLCNADDVCLLTTGMGHTVTRQHRRWFSSYPGRSICAGVTC